MRIFTVAFVSTLLLGVAVAQKPDSPPSQPSAQATQTPARDSESASAGAKSTAAVGKIQTFKGVLVDAGCATGDSHSASSSAGPAAADRSSTPDATSASKAKIGETNRSGEANRAASDSQAARAGGSGASCHATSSTADFGLQTHEGRLLHFDAVGNERTKEEFSSNKGWANASAAGREIRGPASGVDSGDTLMVLSIH